MKTLFSLSAVMAFVPMTVRAQNFQPAPGNGSAAFYFENDVFGGEDRDYTNGMRLSWLSEDRNDTELGILAGPSRLLASGRSGMKYNYGVSLTQLIYTPAEGDAFTQTPGQRRYAGWMGLGFSLHAKDENILNMAELIIGSTGSASLAEQTQNIAHNWIGTRSYNGWDDQVPTEITADLSFVQKRSPDWAKWKDGIAGLDGTMEWGARLGTFRTSAHVGGMVRVGFNLQPDFSDLRISDTAYTQRCFDTRAPGTPAWSAYLLFGTTLTGVAHDATLDGPVFHDFETGNKRVPFVAEVFAGGAVRYRSFELSYVHTVRTEEYEDQEGASNFGSLMLSYRF